MILIFLGGCCTTTIIYVCLSEEAAAIHFNYYVTILCSICLYVKHSLLIFKRKLHMHSRVIIQLLAAVLLLYMQCLRIFNF